MLLVMDKDLGFETRTLHLAHEGLDLSLFIYGPETLAFATGYATCSTGAAYAGLAAGPGTYKPTTSVTRSGSIGSGTGEQLRSSDSSPRMITKIIRISISKLSIWI